MPYKQYYEAAHIPAFWENIWEKEITALTKDNYVLSMIKRHANKIKGIVIECGCGNAQFLEPLQNEGTLVLGLDFTKKALAANKKRNPALLLVCGDAQKLPLKEKVLGMHLSLGLVEHFEEGPNLALQEAHRCLKDEGVLICSVPYYNPIRRIFWKYIPPQRGAAFYQYFFTEKEFTTVLKRSGFTIVGVDYYDVQKGLFDFFPKLKKTARQKIDIVRDKAKKEEETIFNKVIHGVYIFNIFKTISKTRVVKKFTCHMILFIAKRMS